MKSETEHITYRFVKQYATKFGEAVYLSGSLKELGSWNPKDAIKMTYDEQYHWMTEVVIPTGVHI